MKISTRSLVIGAMIAALYVALTLLLQAISFGAIQLRVAEAMTLLPVLFPESIPGLFVGCLVANLLGGYGIADIVFGSLATLLSALLTWKLRKNLWLAALPPVLINAVVIGIMLYYVANAPLFLTMLTVGGGQALSVYVLGIPLLKVLQKHWGKTNA
ncbi:MAG TPA: QueT transporter family protein [Clostridia bacterium]|nr:QueT transporter family protein [Clostridia bacterium]